MHISALHLQAFREQSRERTQQLLLRSSSSSSGGAAPLMLCDNGERATERSKSSTAPPAPSPSLLRSRIAPVSRMVALCPSHNASVTDTDCSNGLLVQRPCLTWCVQAVDSLLSPLTDWHCSSQSASQPLPSQFPSLIQPLSKCSAESFLMCV